MNIMYNLYSTNFTFVLMTEIRKVWQQRHLGVINSGHRRLDFWLSQNTNAFFCSTQMNKQDKKITTAVSKCTHEVRPTIISNMKIKTYHCGKRKMFFLNSTCIHRKTVIEVFLVKSWYCGSQISLIWWKIMIRRLLQ